MKNTIIRSCISVQMLPQGVSYRQQWTFLCRKCKPQGVVLKADALEDTGVSSAVSLKDTSVFFCDPRFYRRDADISKDRYGANVKKAGHYFRRIWDHNLMPNCSTFNALIDVCAKSRVRVFSSLVGRYQRFFLRSSLL